MFDVHSIQNPPDSPYLDQMKLGTKKYEGRLATKIKEWDLFIGKEMKFVDGNNPNSWILIRVTELLQFNDFGEAFDALGSELIPNKTKTEVVELYANLFCKSESEIRIIGVVAIGIEVIDYM